MKKDLIKIGLSIPFFLCGLLINTDLWWLNLGFFLVAYLIVGLEVVIEALSNIFRGQVFDENFLMALATVGAFAIGEYPEAVAVMLFFRVGEVFEHYAVNKSRKSISDLMNIRPDFANIIRDGEIVTIDPYDAVIGDKILVKPGEKIPLDGTVIEGSSMLDTSALTGESVPRDINVGDLALSGCINMNGVITIEAEKEFGESTVSKILDLVENASSKKSKSENFITRFAAVYTPIVVIAAVLLAVIPPLLIQGESFSDWLYRALSFLVISCPCALVISVPLSFFGGIGGASKIGVLVKGSNYLEVLAKTDTVVFDKTGTLTQGVFEVQEIAPQGLSNDELLEIAAYSESFSNHPISISLKNAYGKEIDNSRLSDATEISGHGVSVVFDGKKVFAGNSKLMDREGIEYNKVSLAGTIVYVAVNGEYKGYILIADKVKNDAQKAISMLKSAGVNKTVMLTGDSNTVAQAVGNSLGIDEIHSELLPGDKVEELEKIISNVAQGKSLAFVGDGINDAPVLARADVGIAMGGLGSDAAIEAADIVIMTDEPSKIATAIGIARKTLNISKQNIVFALGIKALVLVLAAFGVSTMWEAVFADVGVSVIAILNSMRALRVKNK